jgi:hypothetical protein
MSKLYPITQALKIGFFGDFPFINKNKINLKLKKYYKKRLHILHLKPCN